jgi:hypothetical protein
MLKINKARLIEIHTILLMYEYIECTFLYNVSYFRNVIKIYTSNLHDYEQQTTLSKLIFVVLVSHGECY